MEDGILTDGKGRTISFKNVVLAMTSNVGSKRILEVSREATQSADGSAVEVYDADERNNALYPKYMEVVTEALEVEMRPELLNRIDEIVVFAPLSQNDLSNIADLLMQKTVHRAEKELKGMEILIQPGLVERVVQEGSANAAQFGARPMRRAAQRFLEDGISDAIIQGFLKEGDVAEIDIASTSTIGMEEILIKRRRDGETLSVLVEDGTGGIGQTFNGGNVIEASAPNGARELQVETQATEDRLKKVKKL